VAALPGWWSIPTGWGSRFQAISVLSPHAVVIVAINSYSHGRDFGAALRRQAALRAAHLGEVFWVLAGGVYARLCLHAGGGGPLRGQRPARPPWLVPNRRTTPGRLHRARRAGLNLGADDPRRATPSAPSRCTAPPCSTALVRIPAGNPHGEKAPLAPLLRRAMDNGQVSAELYTGAWTDVGTPQRLAQHIKP
jgi:MurNAc alpha-1-phosphate uridylyltransferase